jgi:hypothetical protein
MIVIVASVDRNPVARESLSKMQNFSLTDGERKQCRLGFDQR